MYTPQWQSINIFLEFYVQFLKKQNLKFLILKEMYIDPYCSTL